MSSRTAGAPIAVAALLGAAALAVSLAPASAEMRGSVELTPCPIPGTREEMLCGSYEVFENRRKQKGRRITLDIAVLPARGRARRSPLFWITGGPGAAATEDATWLRLSPLRDRSELVLLDQRGAGDSNPLHCDLPGSAEDLQGYLEGAFDRVGVYRRCRRQLRKRANLKHYTTPLAMDDLEELRSAMGYGKIDLWGGSYGTRAVLVYLRRHPKSVRSAILSGVAPPSLRNPLYHASAAQRALEVTFDDCAADLGCARAFPDLESDFREVMARLEEGAVPVTVEHPDTRQPVAVSLTREAFAEAVRLLMYSMRGNRWVPLLVHYAARDILEPMTEVAILRSRAIREGGLAIGMLMSVVCSEDVPRIDPAEIEPLTSDTFLGDVRVRTQMAACQVWPRGRVPADYGDPVTSEVPVLLWSGSHDPVTPPAFAEEAAVHLANSLHLVVPGAHGEDHGCIDSVNREFLNRASVEDLDTRCIGGMFLPAFELP